MSKWEINAVSNIYARSPFFLSIEANDNGKRIVWRIPPHCALPSVIASFFFLFLKFKTIKYDTTN